MMKNISIVLSLVLFAQFTNGQKDDSYKTLWDKVEKLDDENLSKSALKLVESISKKAKDEKNDVQTIKALLYKSNFVMVLEEDAQLSIVNDFKTEITAAESPTKNILHSYLANLYWQYYQQNRYRFYNRTTTETKIDTVDFRTWDLDTLFKEIDHHFQASLENSSETQKLPISYLDEILYNEEETREYRPTIFDLLAHNALDFYTTNENTINKPADIFEIDDAEVLCEAYSFSFSNLESDATTSLQFRALIIYQQLVSFHFSNPDIKPLVLVDIERLLFIHKNATFSNKDELLLDVLQNSAENIKHSPLSGLYTYEIALFYQQLGLTYSPKTNEKHQWKLKEAATLCDAIITKFPESLGAKKSTVLKLNIKESNVQLTTEQHIPTNITSRLLVRYKNFENLTLSAYKITKKQLKELDKLYPEAKKQSFLKNLPIAKTWSASLKTENDFQTHSTEILMPALENGYYAIVAEPIDKKDSLFSYATVQATNLAISETQTNTHQFYQVFDRTNGKPITNAEVIFNYRKNYNSPSKQVIYFTDTKGSISIEKNKDSWNSIDVTIKKDNDTSYFGDYYISRGYSQNRETVNHTCFLFTDRSIYRPGQPLYFKGIAIRQENGKSSILDNKTIQVKLHDVNGQELQTKTLSTNEYGSVSGEFILPINGLTGMFSIHVDSDEIDLNGYTSFSIEEYKRPKFETSFEPITETYKVNDSINVTGKATAYAGSSISDAKVVYRVKRIVNLPRWYYWFRPYFNSTPQEITHGETTTDTSGNYQISFKAIPDNSIDKESLPTFNYEVTADVTDINGETRSTVTNVSVGYHALNVNLVILETIDKTIKNNTFSISSTNLNGEFVAATGNIKLYKLEAPDNVLRPRTWPAPDYAGFSKETFKELYPHDAFENEDNPVNWKKGKVVWQSNFDTGTSIEMNFGKTKNWKSGKYSMELASKDKFGQTVKDVAIITVTGNEDTLADNQLFEIKTDKSQYKIGDIAQITFLSSAKNLNITIVTEKKHHVIDSKVIVLNNNSKTISVPVTADDLGGFSINYSYAFANYFESNNYNIQVPCPATDLQIETISFRDKLAPGTDETWSFKIKGSKGEKVSAELLASMYDASLDQFKPHSWNFNPLSKPTYYSNFRTIAQTSFSTSSFYSFQGYDQLSYSPLNFDSFNWFGLNFGSYGMFSESRKMKRSASSAPLARGIMNDGAELDEVAITGNNVSDEMEADLNAPMQPEADEEKTDFDSVTIRKNLQETAFFFPKLETDKEGNVSFNFTTPEALTRWNLQLLTHTKELESTIKNLTTVTQKELMVTPNAPRFLREGDEIIISTKISNLTNKILSGQAKLVLVDAMTGSDILNQLIKTIAGETNNAFDERSFEVDSMGNTQVSWKLNIPKGLQSVQYKIIAKAGDYSDGEQNMLPVLTNRTLVTETLPMWVRSNQTKTFVLNKLKNLPVGSARGTLKHHKLTLEMTSNPAWYAVQALPYLMEYPYECNEQTFAKYYANTLASHIANSNPRIQEVFAQWANSDALLSNLEKNQELKSLLIQETPWLRDAKSETEQKKRIGLLFNLNKIRNEQELTLNKLNQNQKPSGAWPWFNGGPDNRFITRHIVTGLGHLNHLNVTSAKLSNQSKMIENAISYLDKEFVEEYESMKKNTADINNDHLTATQIQFLYMRSFFKDIETPKKVDEITIYYKKQAQKYWMNKGLYSQGMLALTLYRNKDEKTASKILRSLEENSITSDELGMYWKKNTSSWFWYQAPIETQSLLIEAFSEIHPTDIETIDNLKIWLLKNKQTNQWKTTKATTEAVYALLLQGSDWLSVTDAVDVLVGGEKLEPSTLENVKVEAGTGYFKTSWNGTEIAPKMGEVQITKKGNGIAWGALYWQYFEDLDKITSAETPLQLKKKLFLKKNTKTGEVISEITDTTSLKVGDLVRIRIELKADRDMEFIHMKDMRAAGFEPINVISRYKWQDGLGYYESTKDASTNFFFDYLRKGIYVFEYDVRVNNAGNFSNGITTIQSMYAPEFSSHSEGVRVSVENK
ncbi:MG2 domain-containing protein [uncultured Maribacter sp.]|uniref:alpha-2-macroglobulin family protein n=1 Tax=uncultured Maribacter sp. TaxID=431308 RepID=UPI0030ED6F09|tara:strand:- start:23450 stop:29530 length:6081 start_codon:yes stop_codon:yes gene_type:complete